MAIGIGSQLGSHEITALLGKGGMGEVYRGRDSKLKREVAIKVLPDEFARDASRVSRFQREAEVLASLNHPNIASIYDLQEANGSRYLVLELVEGETLADRIARGPIPVTEALEILFQTRISGGVANLVRPQYAIAKDGRFLINQLAEESSATPITLILNSAHPQ